MKKIKTLVASATLGVLLTSTCVSTVSAKVENRLGGKNRYSTAEAIANNLANGKVDNIVLASGKAPYDALSASLFAKNINAPILLADNSRSTCPETFNYITNHLNKSGTVYILGGEGAIEKKIETDIKKLGYKTERIYGKNRLDTNSKILDKLTIKEGIPVFITSSSAFGDSLSVSSLSAINGYPLIMTNKDSLSSQLKNHLNKIKPSKVYVIGSKALISENIINEIKNINKSLKDSDITRIFGKDRYETNILINKAFNINSSNAVIASGQGFADALTGSALASKLKAPIILTNGKDFVNQKAYIKSTDYINYYILGLEGSVNKSIETLLNNETTNLKDGQEFFGKIVTANHPKSFEQNSKCTIKFSATGLNGEMQNQYNQMLSLMGDTITVNSNSKNEYISKNSFKQESTSTTKYSGLMAGMPSTTPTWTDINENDFRLIYGIPESTSTNLGNMGPEFEMFKDKKYMVISSDGLNKFITSEDDININKDKLEGIIKDFSPKLEKLALKFISNYHPNIDMIKKLGNAKTSDGREATCYKLNINNDTLKSLISYTGNNTLNFIQDKDVVDFIKSYINACIEISSKNKDADKATFEKEFSNFLSNMPSTSLSFNKVLDCINSLDILGNEGIEITYYLSDKGIVLSEDGSIDFKLDLGKLNNIINDKDSKDIKGVVFMKIMYTNNTTNINGDIKVNVPEVNKENSIDYFEMIKRFENIAK
ncbi:cell wall-binding repeat-containing protein [Clostridium rectalis]|uniref:cell wall-binding repeat-containing protein n=1 Tax=Clostridium rectalis TaxID=2040295 RepID=UPI000F63B1DB|nr:cell wall-binding repeat-containing protein [Clostridium rectalis]